MKKRILGAKIACLDINLQKTRMQLGVQILVDDPNQLEEIRKRYDHQPSFIRSVTVSHQYEPLLMIAERLRSPWSVFARSSPQEPMWY